MKKKICQCSMTKTGVLKILQATWSYEKTTIFEVDSNGNIFLGKKKHTHGSPPLNLAVSGV